MEDTNTKIPVVDSAQTQSETTKTASPVSPAPQISTGDAVPRQEVQQRIDQQDRPQGQDAQSDEGRYQARSSNARYKNGRRHYQSHGQQRQQRYPQQNQQSQSNQAQGQQEQFEESAPRLQDLSKEELKKFSLADLNQYSRRYSYGRYS